MKQEIFKLLILLIILSVLSQKAISQSKPEIEWEKTYGGYSRDELHALLPTDDNGYLLGGWTMSTDGDIKSGNKGQSDFWVVKTNEQGLILWEKTFGLIGDEIFSDFKPTSDGGFIIGGSTNMINLEKINPLSGIQNFLIYKIDKFGNIIWVKIFGGNGNDELSKIQPTDDGGFLLLGSTTSVDGDVQSRSKLTYNWLDVDIWVVKIDKNGQLLWEKSFGKINSGEGISCVYPLIGEGYLLGGYSQTNKNGITSSYGDFYILKIDTEGKLIWEKTYGGTSHENISVIFSPSKNGYLLIGGTNSVDGDVQSRKSIQYQYDNFDLWIVKIDKTGNLLWEKSYGEKSIDLIQSGCITSQNDYVLAGYSDVNLNPNDVPQFDSWLVKIDSLGNKTLDKTYGGTDTDAFTSIIATNNNKFVIGGYTKSNYGDIQSGNHGAQNPWTHGRLDFWVMKYNLNFTLSNEIITKNTNLYPNPTKDKLQIDNNEEGIISIFDILGKLLLQQRVTKYNQVIDVSFIPSGTYILKFNSINHHESSKFIKM